MIATPVLSTSWDDGDPADLRLAEQLIRHGLRGTFYLCRDRSGRPRLSEPQIKELAAIPQVEVGSHTLTHPDLRRLSQRQVDIELRDSKAWLEDLIGKAVTSFCYPKGLHRRSLAGRVAAAGYALGRTTMSGHTDTAFDPFLMPTTMQLYPHRRSTQVRHAVKERDIHGLRGLLAVRGWSTQPAELAQEFVDLAGRTADQPVAIHAWGHSWEIDQIGLWSALGDLFGYLRDLAYAPVTNRELAQLANRGRHV
jgi:peptidoglycan/xylan/chitin deacetylase (PgdA/CDA1 family)